VQQNPQDYGINNGITTDVVLPQITVQGVGLNFGGPGGFPQGRIDTTFVLSDTVSYLTGRHSFKIGGEYRNFHNVNFQTNGGTFTYPSLADFQAGRGSAFTVTLGDIDSDITQKAFGLFVQDSFKVRSNLTFELGFRYDLNVAPTEADDHFVYFDPGTVSLYQVGQGPRDKLYENKSNYQPRVGFVWDPFKDGRTSVRAAYSLMSDQPVTNLASQTVGPPFVQPLSFAGAAGSIRLDNALNVAQASGLAPLSVDSAFQNGRVQTWNVNVQREIARNMSVMVGYFGSKGDSLRVSLNQNQVTGGVRPYPRLAASSPIFPNSALGNIISVASKGYSHYDGVWTTLTRRFSNGLQFNGSYTWSKSKDTNSLSSTTKPPGQPEHRGGLRALGLRRSAPLRPERDLGPPLQGKSARRGLAVLAHHPGADRQPDQRHHQPELHRRRKHDPPRPDRKPRGLRAAGAVELDERVRPAGGRPVHVLVGLGPALHERRAHPGTFPRNSITGPGFYNTDLSIIKKTKVASTTVELRAEAFNLFNHPNFGFPLATRTAVPGGTAFGVITATRLPTGDSGSARQIQFALKVLF
jgi:hypothetical protein